MTSALFWWCVVMMGDALHRWRKEAGIAVLGKQKKMSIHTR